MKIKSKLSVRNISITAMLIAFGVVISAISPLRIIIEPASYTLASHTATFIALFISPMCAVAVALGTTIGFLVSGATPVIVWRAFSHIIFAVLGGWWLYRHPHTVQSPLSRNVFSFVLGLVHVICEIAVVSFFFLGGALSEAYYTYGYWITVLGLVGVGGLVHSMIDFEIAWIIVRGLRRMKELENLFLSSGK